VAEPWTQDDTGLEIADGAAALGEETAAIGFVWRYNRVSGVLYAAFRDGTLMKYDSLNSFFEQAWRDGADFKYDAAGHILTELMQDGSVFQYDASQKAYSAKLASGATYTISANGATIVIDASGNVTINSPGTIKLAGGGPAVARVGDSTTCPAGTGSITGGSSKVTSG